MEWHLFVATASTVALFALPWIFSLALRKSKRSKPALQRKIWISGEACLAAGLLLAFLASFSSLVVVKNVIAPWIWETDSASRGMDETLTARGLFYWMTVVFSAWFVFRAIGLNALRDLHKIIKECHDLVLQNRKNELRRASREQRPRWEEPDQQE